MQKVKKTALERIRILFEQAEANPKFADRYVQLARKIQMKARVRMPKELKRKYCSHCYSFLKSGINARIRTREGKLIIYCNNCKKYTRIPLTT